MEKIPQIPINEPNLNRDHLLSDSLESFEDFEKETIKESVLFSLASRLLQAKDFLIGNAGLVGKVIRDKYFDFRLNESIKKFASEPVVRGVAQMAEAALGESKEIPFDLKKASVKFSAGLIISIKDLLEQTPDAKINKDSKLGKVILAAKKILGTEKASNIVEEFFTKEK